MARWKIHTPEGMQDILFRECYIKRNLENSIRELFRSCGYNEVETPSVEYYDVFSGDTELVPQEDMYKFSDSRGRILVLRPDLTVPIARLAATRLRDVPLPLKISYIGNVFRFNELGGGKQKEFTQAGVELLGADTPQADAEVVILAINTVIASGITEFQIDMGQVEFFKGLMEEADLNAEETEQIRAAIDEKNYVRLESIISRHSVEPRLKDLIMSLPQLFGNSGLLKKLRSETCSRRAIEALEYIEKVIDIVAERGLGKYISVDLGMVQSLDYYTGLIFRGVTRGMGFPILSGGRYDGLVGRFGRECPAVGFSLGVNMVMSAMERQGDGRRAE